MAKTEALIQIRTETGNSDANLKKLDKEINNVKKSAKDTKGSINGATDAIGQMNGPIGGAIDGVKGLANSFKALLANPIGIVIGAVVAVFAALYAIFKDFAPLLDFISDKVAYLNGLFQGLRTVIFNFVSGVDNATTSITEQANAMERANQLTRDYEDNLDSLALKQAQYEAQIDKLLKQAKNKSISDKQANELLAEATRLQNDQINLLKESSKLETAALIEKAKGYGATYKQILAIQKGASIASLGNLSEELDKALSELQKNYTKRVQEEGQLEEKKEKIKNAYDAKEEARKAKEQKRIDEENKKREEAIKKEQEFLDLKNKNTLKYINAQQDLRIQEAKNEEDAIWAEVEAQNEADYLERKRDEERLKRLKEDADKEKKIDEERMNTKLMFANEVGNLLKSISSLMGQQSEEAKALAAAGTLIDTYVAAFRAYTEGFKIDPTGVFSVLSAAAAAATGLKAVQNILNTDATGGAISAGSTTASAPPPITRPTSSFVQLDNRNPLDVNNVGMTKVVVVESDITQVQNEVKSIKAKATIG